MFKQSGSGWLVVILLLTLVLGLAGGGVMGGVAGYYVAHSQAVVTVPTGRAVLTAQVSTQAPTATAAQTSTVAPSGIEDMVQKAAPGVVTIVTAQPSRPRRFNPGSFQVTSEGSGVIVDKQGHIVTNAHVVQGAMEIQVILSNGNTATATLIGADSNNDVAVLQIGSTVPGILSFGDSSGVRVGQPVVAIGSALGTYQGSVTTGVISGLDRSVDGSGLSGLIQTDAAINHGNSGGPLLNVDGEVIGINTLVIQTTDSGELAEGLGFAVPSNVVSSIVEKIIASAQTP